MRKLTSLLIALALSLVMGAAIAQTTPTLTFEGSVMVSTADGEFVSASYGQEVVAGQTVMVPADGSAALTYSNGAVTTLGPGTHVVPAAAVVTTTTGVAASAGMTAGIVAGAVILTAALIDQNLDESDEPPPLSP